MASGGARARSGPAKDPNSGRSDRLGVRFTPLDPAGFSGKAPDFPLGPVEAFYYTSDGQRTDDEVASEQRNCREAELWAWVWTLPQANAWILEPWRWLSVANWVRLQAVCETDYAKAADKTALLRLATQIGLSPEGLSLNNWVIEVSDDTGGSQGPVVPSKRKTSRDRMKVNIKVVEGGDK